MSFMTANALVQTRINRAVKDEASAVLATMGLTVSDAVRLLLTRVAHDKALPFEPLIPNAETIAAMQEARSGNLMSYNSGGALMADLNADDGISRT
jgi:DNA-damage-inducible protein J